MAPTGCLLPHWPPCDCVTEKGRSPPPSQICCARQTNTDEGILSTIMEQRLTTTITASQPHQRPTQTLSISLTLTPNEPTKFHFWSTLRSGTLLSILPCLTSDSMLLPACDADANGAVAQAAAAAEGVRERLLLSQERRLGEEGRGNGTVRRASKVALCSGSNSRRSVSQAFISHSRARWPTSPQW